MHRGDEEALRAKNEVLERELADARAALAAAQARGTSSSPSVTARWFRRLRGGLERAGRWLAPPAARELGWGRSLGLGAWTFALAVGSALVTTVAATYGDAIALAPAADGPSRDAADAMFWAALAWLFVGPVLAIGGLASSRRRARRPPVSSAPWPCSS